MKNFISILLLLSFTMFAEEIKFQKIASDYRDSLSLGCSNQDICKLVIDGSNIEYTFEKGEAVKKAYRKARRKMKTVKFVGNISYGNPDFLSVTFDVLTFPPQLFFGTLFRILESSAIMKFDRNFKNVMAGYNVKKREARMGTGWDLRHFVEVFEKEMEEK